ncbi:MAG: nuclear transport factor 2 family protein [Burkholderiaceae bacterium]
MTPIERTLERWHTTLAGKDAEGLDALLADDAVFVSPVVHTPQRGKAITKAYLAAALQVFGQPSFRYLDEIVGAHRAVLEFSLEIEGVEINGVDMITVNERGEITEFKVMIRPLKAIQLIHRMMGEMLARRA